MASSAILPPVMLHLTPRTEATVEGDRVTLGQGVEEIPEASAGFLVDAEPAS
jgi:hypothetical protein